MYFPPFISTYRSRSLICLLLIAVIWMGFMSAQRQILGPLHLHAVKSAQMQVSSPQTELSLLDKWLIRWHQQKLLGHQKLELQLLPSTHQQGELRALSKDHIDVSGPHSHQHGEFARHHHMLGDTTVIAVDGSTPVGEAMYSAGSGTWLLLSLFAISGHLLAFTAMARFQGPWPVGDAARFSTWREAPPLRPPSR